MRKLIINFFEFCGYDVEDSEEVNNPLLNFIDTLLLIVYILLSFKNIVESESSLILLFINAVTLTRFIVENIIELKKIVNSKINDGKKRISLVHWTKIIIECFSMFILTLVFAWTRITAQDLSVVKFIVSIVIILTFFEDFLKIFERLYQAIPKPLSY